MTIRGGGNPTLDMASVPRLRMGPPPRSFAADAYDCIMVQGPAGPHRIQVCGALPAPDGELPSDNTRVRQKDPT